jgi:hypothetical protein
MPARSLSELVQMFQVSTTHHTHALLSANRQCFLILLCVMSRGGFCFNLWLTPSISQSLKLEGVICYGRVGGLSLPKKMTSPMPIIALLWLCFLRNGVSFQHTHSTLSSSCGERKGLSHSRRSPSCFALNSSSHNQENGAITKAQKADAYAAHWEQLLNAEHREAVQDLRQRRATWSRVKLEEIGLSVFDASAEPESDLFGEKIVRIFKEGGEARQQSQSSFRDKFTRGDVLEMTTISIGADQSYSKKTRSIMVPRDCCVVDVGTNWITAAVGPFWPAGLWEARRSPGAFQVRLDKVAPQAPLKAQDTALRLTRHGQAGKAVCLLVDVFCRGVNGGDDNNSTYCDENAAEVPLWLQQVDSTKRNHYISNALGKAKKKAPFEPNTSQEDAIQWALSRNLSLIRGPPGTGKTRVAAMLISTALQLDSILKQSENSIKENAVTSPRRILAVAHSNGAADVLLQALLDVGVPAIRAGRPASVSPSVLHRTVLAMADRHPEVIALRARAHDISVNDQARMSTALEIKLCLSDVCRTILKTAPVVVASCIGANQLLEDNFGTGIGAASSFPMVVLDEAAQTTEPALVCALAAARAEQVVMVGDTQQLPPTVASESKELRTQLGTSPMARLLQSGVAQQTLRLQYRMSPTLCEFPSKYFYDGLVECAKHTHMYAPPAGFAWPKIDDDDKKQQTHLLPLSFVNMGDKNGEVAHEFGGRSNPSEAELVADIVVNLMKEGDMDAKDIAIITPYVKQVQRLRMELAAPQRAAAMMGKYVRVGTVDSFQGQEMDLIIFSAVRSNPMAELGFLHDPRRLCVAITRARRGLILVGDQQVLQSSRHWSALLDSCQDRGCIQDVDDLHRVVNEESNKLKQVAERSSMLAEPLLLFDNDDNNNELMGLLHSSSDEESDELLEIVDSL